MENASETIARRIVSTWMHENKLYLLDGDMRILHPIAREALVNVITHELSMMKDADETSQLDGKAKARKKGKDRPADG
jgi:hypothetical protein